LSIFENKDAKLCFLLLFETTLKHRFCLFSLTILNEQCENNDALMLNGAFGQYLNDILELLSKFWNQGR